MYFFIISFFVVVVGCEARRISVPRSGIKSVPSALGARNLNHQGSPFITSFNKVFWGPFLCQGPCWEWENKSRQNHQGLCSHRTFHLVTGTETKAGRYKAAWWILSWRSAALWTTELGPPLSQRVAARGVWRGQRELGVGIWGLLRGEPPEGRGEAEAKRTQERLCSESRRPGGSRDRLCFTKSSLGLGDAWQWVRLVHARSYPSF